MEIKGNLLGGSIDQDLPEQKPPKDPEEATQSAIPPYKQGVQKLNSAYEFYSHNPHQLTKSRSSVKNK